MYSRCLFCHKPFRANGELRHLPLGRQIAYDPDRRRLWVICQGCHKWSLVPVEDRAAAIDEFERLTRDRGHVLGHTDNIALLSVRNMSFVRVGNAGLVEQAWWRYGRELQRRRTSYTNPISRVAAYGYGALAYLGETVGFTDYKGSLSFDGTPIADVLRWRRFGWTAWHGRVECPHCKSVLTSLRFDTSWWMYTVPNPGGEVSVGIPCPRCDPWTPEKSYRLKGFQAESLLRRVLAYQHISGASERTVRDAAEAIEAVGSAELFAKETSLEWVYLRRLTTARSIALEIAVNERAERRMLDMELSALEFVWKREEELARIIDEELTSRRTFDRPSRPATAGSEGPDRV